MNWDQLVATVEQYGPTVAIMALLVLFLVGLRKAWPTITLFVTSINTVAKLPATLERMEGQLTTLSEDMAHVKHEVQTNSGGSLKDSAKVTEQIARETQKTVSSLQGTVRSQGKKLVALQAGQLAAAELLAGKEKTPAT